MTRLRFTLGRLMAIVLYLGFAFAALRNADEFWANAAYTLAVILNSGALVGAFVRAGKSRTPFVGFAIFGWTYLLINHLPGWNIGGLGFGPIWRPVLLFEWATARLQPFLKPVPPGMGGGQAGDFLMAYEQVSYSLGIILAGVVGAVLGPLLAVKDERRDQ
jgi:hypothetical protein